MGSRVSRAHSSDESPRVCNPECNVAHSFLELFQLLEQYTPAWYSEDLRQRAVKAKALLDSSVPHTRLPDSSEFTKALLVFLDLEELLDRHASASYPEPLRRRVRGAFSALRAYRDAQPLPGAGPTDRGEASVGDKANRIRGELEYVSHKLYLAVRSAVRSELSLPRRLLDSYLDLFMLDLQEGLPTDLRQRFVAMTNACTCDAEPGGERWSAEVTIEKMDREEVCRWLDEMLILLLEATKCQVLI